MGQTNLWANKTYVIMDCVICHSQNLCYGLLWPFIYLDDIFKASAHVFFASFSYNY